MASSKESDSIAQPEATPLAAPSGRETEEDIRRKVGRPKSVRPTDFEPLAWESSLTKVDRGEFFDDVGSGEKPRLGSCFSWLANGLKAAWGRLSVFEMASVSAFVIVALIGMFFFRSLVHSGPTVDEDVDTSLSAIDFPAKGAFLTVNQVSAVWREPKAGEVVRPGANIVPTVTIVLGGGSGFLRVIFRDELGKIRGDSLVEKVTNGQISTGASYTGVCSDGFRTSMRLIETQAGRLEPWTAHIYDSKDFDMPISEWTLIAAFDVPTGRPAEGGDSVTFEGNY